MKKILYAISALAILAGCAKTETEFSGNETSEVKNLSLTVAAATESGTKASYDGAGRVVWASGDNIYLALGGSKTPVPVKVARSAGAAAGQYFSPFKIKDAAADVPEFTGSFYSIVEEEWEENYTLYGMYPQSAMYNSVSYNDDLSKIVVEIKADQTATQTSWDGRYDVMLVEPAPISLSNYSYDSTYKEYSSDQTTTIRFAHLFGFGCLSFAGIPAEYENQVVKRVIVSATGQNKDFIGRYTVDMTKKVTDPDFSVKVASSLKDLYLAGDGVTTVKDYKAWFVANPGTFDIEVTVETNAANFVFDRSGLVIERSAVSSPVVNYREKTDKFNSKDVDLTGDLRWQHIPSVGGSSMSLTSTYPEREWGTLADSPKMLFGCSYPGQLNSNYPSFSTPIQYVANSNISGGTVVLESGARFKGVRNIKFNSGINTNNADCKVTAYLVSLAGEETKIGESVQINGTTADQNGQNIYITVPDGPKEGRLKLVWNEFTETSCRPYILDIAVNDIPGIELSETAVKVPAAGVSGEILCNVFLADGDPSVSVSGGADWITASYEDGKIKYTVSQNDGAGRTASITVSATGLAENTAEIEVKQVSATAVEYKAHIDAEGIEEAIEAAAALLENPTSGTVLSFDVDFTATATDGSQKTTDITVRFNNVYYDCIGEYIYLRYNYSSPGTIVWNEPAGMVAKIETVANQYMATSMYSGINAQLSKNGTTWPTPATFNPKYESTDGIYTSYIENDDEEYTWFKITANTNCKFTSIEITFVVE